MSLPTNIPLFYCPSLLTIFCNMLLGAFFIIPDLNLSLQTPSPSYSDSPNKHCNRFNTLQEERTSGPDPPFTEL